MVYVSTGGQGQERYPEPPFANVRIWRGWESHDHVFKIDELKLVNA